MCLDQQGVGFGLSGPSFYDVFHIWFNWLGAVQVSHDQFWAPPGLPPLVIECDDLEFPPPPTFDHAPYCA